MTLIVVSVCGCTAVLLQLLAGVPPFVYPYTVLVVVDDPVTP